MLIYTCTVSFAYFVFPLNWPQKCVLYYYIGKTMEVILKENVTWLIINFNLFFCVRICVRALNFHTDHMDRITVNWNPEQGKKPNTTLWQPLQYIF